MSRDDELPPDFLERIDPGAFSVPDLIGLVLARHAAPLSIEEIATRLDDLGVFRSVPSLRKTWARLRCLRKTADGRLEIVRENADYSVWDSLAFRVRKHLGLLKRFPAKPEAEKPPVDETSPVELDEVLRGLESRLSSSLSVRRKLALFAEASGGPLAVERAIELLGKAGARYTERDVHSAVGGPVYFDEDRRLRHVPDDRSLVIARRLLRERLRELDERAEQEKEIATRSEEREREKRIELEAERAKYLKARKAAIRCVFTRKGFAAASVLDPDRRAFQDFTEAAELASHLAECDMVFGLDPWADLERLGVKPRGGIVDLSPPVKTVRLHRRGRTLKVTPRLIIASTLRLSHSVGDPKKLGEYVKEGNLGKLFRRLQSDLKALWRLYDYGCLHGVVRLRRGSLDEWRGVGWNIGALPRLRELLAEAKEKGEDLEVVFDSVPDWEDPWSRGERARVIGSRGTRWSRKYVVELVNTGARRWMRTDEVFAARIFRETPTILPGTPATAASSGGRSGGGAAVAGEAGTPDGTFAWPEERDDRVS